MAVRVQVLGTTLHLRTNIPRDVLIQIVRDVETRARQIMELTRETNRMHVFLITALNLALELYETRQTYRALSQTAGNILQELEACLGEEGRVDILTSSADETNAPDETVPPADRPGSDDPESTT